MNYENDCGMQKDHPFALKDSTKFKIFAAKGLISRVGFDTVLRTLRAAARALKQLGAAAR